MSEQNSCSIGQSEQSEADRMNRLCDAIEAQAKAITNFTSVVAEMVAASVDLQEHLAATMMDDGAEGDDGFDHMDIDSPRIG